MINDPYTYEDGTLRNKLNIRDHQELRRAEADIGFLKLINIDSVKASGLNEDLLSRMDTIENLRKEISLRAPMVAKEYKDKRKDFRCRNTAYSLFCYIPYQLYVSFHTAR